MQEQMVIILRKIAQMIISVGSGYGYGYGYSYSYRHGYRPRFYTPVYAPLVTTISYWGIGSDGSWRLITTTTTCNPDDIKIRR
ncbi:hypothetical protein KTG15_07725 [Methanobacterium sp. YSL]|nr:hypothetical protein [Methanobacterium sp. YSL]